MNDPLRAKETFTRVVTDYRDAKEARRAELYLDFIAHRYGTQPAPRPLTTGAPAQNG